MTLEDRTKLFNLAYGLDNRPRVYVPKSFKGFRTVGESELLRLRVQESTGQLYLLLTDDEAALLADLVRECAANDEARLK